MDPLISVFVVLCIPWHESEKFKALLKLDITYKSQ